MVQTTWGLSWGLIQPRKIDFCFHGWAWPVRQASRQGQAWQARSTAARHSCCPGRQPPQTRSLFSDGIFSILVPTTGDSFQGPRFVSGVERSVSYLHLRSLIPVPSNCQQITPIAGGNERASGYFLRDGN